MKYFNTGSVTSVIQMIFSLLAMLKPSVFTSDRQGQAVALAGGLVVGLLGVIHFIDELVASWKSTPFSFNTGMRSIAILLGISLMLGAGGCETSSAFRAAAAQSGPRIADDATLYLKGDTTLDAATLSTRTTQLTMFRSAITQPITFRPVYDAWSAVRPWFVAYAQRDPVYIASPNPGAALALPNSFDDIVEAERHRRMIFFPLDTPPAIGR